MATPETLSHLTLVAIEAALQAGELLRQGFGTQFSISQKEAGTHNLVTEYDYRAEKLVLEFLKDQVPSSYFLAEESGSTGKKPEKDPSSICWIVDPLDGTVNFAHQIPCFAVSIAAEQAGRIVCGVIYQPLTHELFVAERGMGAFLNGVRLSVSKTSALKQSFLSTGFPYNLAENPMNCIDHFTDILKLGIPVRRLGAATIDLSYVAAGRFDGFFEVSLAPWDCAAGILLVEEAGGTITHWNGQPFDLYSYQSILATNGALHDALAQVLQQ